MKDDLQVEKKHDLTNPQGIYIEMIGTLYIDQCLCNFKIGST